MLPGNLGAPQLGVPCTTADADADKVTPRDGAQLLGPINRVSTVVGAF